LDYSKWPTDREALAAHGREDITALVHFFSSAFPDASEQDFMDDMLRQYNQLKAYLKGRNPQLMKVVSPLQLVLIDH
jgi:hypothetical protein